MEPLKPDREDTLDVSGDYQSVTLLVSPSSGDQLGLESELYEACLTELGFSRRIAHSAG